MAETSLLRFMSKTRLLLLSLNVYDKAAERLRENRDTRFLVSLPRLEVMFSCCFFICIKKNQSTITNATQIKIKKALRYALFQRKNRLGQVGSQQLNIQAYANKGRKKKELILNLAVYWMPNKTRLMACENSWTSQICFTAYIKIEIYENKTNGKLV